MELVAVHKAGKSSGIAEECCDILNHEWPRSRWISIKQWKKEQVWPSLVVAQLIHRLMQADNR